MRALRIVDCLKEVSGGCFKCDHFSKIDSNSIEVEDGKFYSDYICLKSKRLIYKLWKPTFQGNKPVWCEVFNAANVRK